MDGPNNYKMHQKRKTNGKSKKASKKTKSSKKSTSNDNSNLNNRNFHQFQQTDCSTNIPPSIPYKSVPYVDSKMNLLSTPMCYTGRLSSNNNNLSANYGSYSNTKVNEMNNLHVSFDPASHLNTIHPFDNYNSMLAYNDTMDGNKFSMNTPQPSAEVEPTPQPLDDIDISSSDEDTQIDATWALDNTNSIYYNALQNMRNYDLVVQLSKTMNTKHQINVSNENKLLFAEITIKNFSNLLDVLKQTIIYKNTKLITDKDFLCKLFHEHVIPIMNLIINKFCLFLLKTFLILSNFLFFTFQQVPKQQKITKCNRIGIL